ncbi:MAG TPA: tRNA uridine-5-carboxymethylaminomethyl(34) synthesis GTPase MnmE, partial [Candidatus Hypogeohydataceae bacterium YC40]
AILRLSGPQAFQCVLERFVSESTRDFLSEENSELTRKLQRPIYKYSCLQGKILVEENTSDLATGTTAPCLLYLMQAPHSYTREDVVEIHTVGSPPLLDMLLEGLISSARKSGRVLRLAEPGEFTKRAFLNGRIDLSQAEAVLRIIRSKNDAELRLAARQLGGETSRILKDAQERLAELLCHIELSLDFSDQDLEPLPLEVLRNRLEVLCKDIACHLRVDNRAYKRGGIRTVLYGPPNVGKSSLFNALLGRPRAITSPHPGTTRDTLEAELTLRGISFYLVDTAGLRQASGIDASAIARSQQAVETSELTLLVMDGSSILNNPLEIFYSITQRKNQTTVLVINKSDLPHRLSPKNLPSPFQNFPMVYTSALTGIGLEKLREEMVERVLNGKVDSTPSLLSSRQKCLLEETLEDLKWGLECMKQPSTLELAALELKEALDTLGKLCGTITSEDILERIFSQFCIGK